MTELSPSAQAVLDAFYNASDGQYVDCVWVVNEPTLALAAALHAVAAAHCEAVEIRTGSGTGEIDVIVRESRILDIAAELEAQ